MARHRNLTIAIAVIAGLLLVVYVLFNSRLIISGPSLVISTPIDGASLDEQFVDIIGVAKNTAYISLNGRPILVDQQGNFKEKLLLSPGISIIEMYARDKFNREILKTLNLNYTGTEMLEIPEEVPQVEDPEKENIDEQGNVIEGDAPVENVEEIIEE